MKRVALILTVILWGACKNHDGEYDFVAGERQGVIPGMVSMAYRGRGQTTNPFDTKEQSYAYEGVWEAWNATISVDDNKSEMTWTRIDSESPLVGCNFSGNGLAQEFPLDTGYCNGTTADGYYRFVQTEPIHNPVEWKGLEVDGIIEWKKGEDFLAGPAFLFWSIPGSYAGPQPYPTYNPVVPTDPLATCKMPSCVSANFANHGTIKTGSPQVCSDLLAGHAAPLPMYFDDLDRMAFAAGAADADKHYSVMTHDACGFDSWTGQKPYPFALFHFDMVANTVVLDEISMHQANNLADVCTIEWTASLDGC